MHELQDGKKHIGAVPAYIRKKGLLVDVRRLDVGLVEHLV